MRSVDRIETQPQVTDKDLAEIMKHLGLKVTTPSRIDSVVRFIPNAIARLGLR